MSDLALALVRPVPESFSDAIVAGPRPLIDVGEARRQHAAYVEALRKAGVRIVEVAADEALPDSPFVEDLLVDVAGLVVITRPGAPARRSELAGAVAALPDGVGSVRLRPPGTLDGGDVAVVGRRVYVGRSSRTDDAGIGRLAALAVVRGLEVVAVEVRTGLHLRSAMSPLTDDLSMVAPGRLDEGALEGLHVVRPAPGEPGGANVLRLPDGTVLVPAACPETASIVEGLGFTVLTPDISQFEAADGGLTCLSGRIGWEDAGWR